MDDNASLSELATRVAALEREVAALRGVPRPAPGMVTPPPPRSASTPNISAEAFVGGRAFLIGGALLVVFGVAFFLNLAFAHGWIGPSMRVALGLLVGTGMIAYFPRMRSRWHPLFVDVLLALGGALDQLSLFAAGDLFHLLPQIVVALGMVAVTGAVFALAYTANRKLLAHLALIGGFLTPLLLGMDFFNAFGLFAFIGTLEGVALVFAELRRWRSVQLVALLGTAGYWLLYYPFDSLTPHGDGPIERLALGLLLYALVAFALAFAWRRSKLDGRQTVILGINAAWFIIGISALLDGYRPLLAGTMLGLALAHILAGRFYASRVQFALAVVAVTFAIPPTFWSFEHAVPATAILLGMHLTWIVEATVIGIIGARRRNRLFEGLSILIFATAGFDLLARYGGSEQALPLLLNDRFLSLVALGLAILLVRKNKSKMFDAMPGWLANLRIVVDVVVLLALSSEASAFAHLAFPKSAASTQEFALSIIWGIYGLALILWGTKRNETVARWEGLVLLGLTALKVLFVDLVAFDQIVRVLSACAIGGILMLVAFLYQRQRKQTHEESA